MRSLGYLLLNTLQALFLVVWSVFWQSLAFVVCIVSQEGALAMARWAWGPGLLWGAQATVEKVPGAEGEIDFSQPHIFVMNHQSMVDVPLAFTHIPANLRFVAKHTLKYVPFLGWYMTLTGMIFVNRSNRSQAVKSLASAGEKIRAGANILAFPEGTRSVDGRILPFKKGVFHVALAAGVPIVPVAAEGCGKLLPRGGFKLRPTKVKLKFGRPIPTAGLTEADRDDLMRRVRDAMIDLHVSIGGAGGDKSTPVALAGREGIGEPDVREAVPTRKAG